MPNSPDRKQRWWVPFEGGFIVEADSADEAGIRAINHARQVTFESLSRLPGGLSFRTAYRTELTRPLREHEEELQARRYRRQWDGPDELLTGHPWRTTLVHLRRHFIRAACPTATVYDGFNAPLEHRRWTAEGERVWAVYAVGPLHCDGWWRAEFTDTRILFRGETAYPEELPYAQVAEASLPGKEVPPLAGAFRDDAFFFDRAFLRTHSGREVEVRGAVGVDGMRDIYHWHSLTAARHDQRRRELGAR